MPTEFSEAIYDYRVETLTFVQWLKAKDDDNWELVAVCPRDFSGMAWKHIFMCIFKRKV